MRRFAILPRAHNGRRLIAGAILLAPGQAAIDLVLLLGLHRATGSFAYGGAGVAALTVASLVTNLVQSRLVDRAGSPRPLLVAAAGIVLASAGWCVADALGAGAGWLLALAVAIGALLPATGATLRTMWSARLPDADERATAFAFVSLTQDVGFLAGPALFGALAAGVSVTVALLGCAATLAAGTVLVATLPGVAGAAAVGDSAEVGRGSGLGALRPLARVAAVMVCLGGALGCLDVSVTAFAVQHHAAALSGVLLGVSSLGGVAGGLWYGSRTWRSGLDARLRTCMLLGTAALVLPALAPGVGLAAGALLLVGAPLSAALTTGYLVGDRDGPAARRTEGFAMLGLALNVGVAAGNAAAGQIANVTSAHLGFLVAAACTLGGATTSLLRR